MGILRLAVAVLAAVALLSSSLDASGFENTGIGVRARAMGGAFRAVADDWTAALYNPAGYAFLKDNQLGGNSAFLHLRDQLTPNYVLGSTLGGDSIGVFNGRPLYNRHEVLSNPSAGVVLPSPFMGGSVLGLSAYQRFDDNVTWQLYSPLRAYNDTADAYVPTDQYGNNLDVVTFQLTAARLYMQERLAVGVGVQVQRGDLVYNDLQFRPTPMTSAPWTDRPYNFIPEFSHSDGSGWGLGFTAGMLYKLTPKAKVAFTASVPMNITLKGQTVLRYLMPRINTEINPPNPQQPGTAGYLFSAGSAFDVKADFKTTLRLPPSFGAGLAYTVTPKLLVALDAEYTLWSRFKGFEFDLTGISGLPLTRDNTTLQQYFGKNVSSPVHWSNAAKVMVGASYEAISWLTVMGGLSADQGANRDGDGFVPQYMDTGTKFGLNGGLQFHIQRWDLGFATSYIRAHDLTVWSVNGNGNGQYESLPGAYRASTYETILSFNYRF